MEVPREVEKVASVVNRKGSEPNVNKKRPLEVDQEAYLHPGAASEPQVLKHVHKEDCSTKRIKFDANQIRRRLAQIQ